MPTICVAPEKPLDTFGICCEGVKGTGPNMGMTRVTTVKTDLYKTYNMQKELGQLYCRCGDV